MNENLMLECKRLTFPDGLISTSGKGKKFVSYNLGCLSLKALYSMAKLLSARSHDTLFLEA